MKSDTEKSKMFFAGFNIIWPPFFLTVFDLSTLNVYFAGLEFWMFVLSSRGKSTANMKVSL